MKGCLTVLLYHIMIFQHLYKKHPALHPYQIGYLPQLIRRVVFHIIRGLDLQVGGLLVFLDIPGLRLPKQL